MHIMSLDSGLDSVGEIVVFQESYPAPAIFAIAHARFPMRHTLDFAGVAGASRR